MTVDILGNFSIIWAALTLEAKPGKSMTDALSARLANQKYLDASAAISDDGCYRYWLSRRLTPGERTVLFVGLNPSTADATQDDPTIRRCVGYARDWGFDWLLMGNIYAWRSTDPKKLKLVDEPVGPGNQDALKWMAQQAELVIAAWGKQRLTCYGYTLSKWVLSLPICRALGFNQDGTPVHPLYQPKNAPRLEIPV